MKRNVILLLVVAFFCAMPCRAQFMKQLKDTLVGQGQQQLNQQPSLLGNVNLPPGQYMMTNVQTGNAFYVFVQNGQMFLSGGPPAQNQQMMAPAAGTTPQSTGGMIKEGLGNFLKNQISPQQQQQGVPYQGGY
ncbi:MAG: hypothetical protein IPM23_18495 [Candidatus Melainabacteria bacterium]|nr:hypothetical protein [Candidatus Melainabacteria bacterium]